MLEEARGIAIREKRQTNDRRADRGVSELVHLAGIEAALEPDMIGVRFDAFPACLGETPAVARDDGRLAVLMVAHREHRTRVVDVSRRIGLVTRIRKQLMRRALVGPPLDEVLAAHALTVFERLRIPRSHALGRFRRIPLHADREHAVTVAEQESVAGIDVGIAVRAARHAVEDRHRGHVPAIDRVDDHAAARLGFDRLQQMELGAVLDESLAIRRREVQVTDRFVTRMLAGPRRNAARR